MQLNVRVTGAQIRVVQDEPALPARAPAPQPRRGPQRRSRVVGRRLDVEVLEQAALLQDAVRHAIESNAPCQTKPATPGPPPQSGGQLEQGLVCRLLKRGGDVGMARGERLTGPPPRAEERLKRAEVIGAKPQRVRGQAQPALSVARGQCGEGRREGPRLPVGRKSHDLARIVLAKAQELGQLLPQESQRMRILQFAELPQLDALPVPEPDGAKLADAIDHEHGGFLERGNQKGAGSVAEVVVEPMESGADIRPGKLRQRFRDRPEPALEQLFTGAASPVSGADRARQARHCAGAGAG